MLPLAFKSPRVLAVTDFLLQRSELQTLNGLDDPDMMNSLKTQKKHIKIRALLYLREQTTPWNTKRQQGLKFASSNKPLTCVHDDILHHQILAAAVNFA